MTMTSTAQGHMAYDMRRPIRRVWMAGIPVDCLSETEILSLFEDMVCRDKQIVLANLNLHGWYAALTTPAMANLLKERDSVVHIDGTPIVWVAKLLGCRPPRRVRNGHIDLIPKMLARCAAAGWPVAIVGSNEQGARDNEIALSALAPGLKIKAFHGFFDLEDRSEGSYQAQVIEELREWKPALLMVGMGMPRQERWIASIKNQLSIPVTMPVGGFADYFAGRTRAAPRFLGPLGLEWLFRLVLDPQRLGFRYLVEPFLLAARVVQATLQGARWGHEDANKAERQN